MSRLENAKGRKDGNSGYGRVLGNEQLGQLLSKVQATVISNGTELEHILADQCQQIEDIDLFIHKVIENKVKDGVYICLKRIIKQSEEYAPRQNPQGKRVEPDMLVFKVEQYRVCKVIELKDGDMFDTKKSEAELENLVWFTTNFGARIPFSTDFYICSFNQEDKQRIAEGLKGVFTIEHIMTGRELCSLLELDYESILSKRCKDAADNLNYFIDKLLAIDEVREKILMRLCQ